MIKKCQITLEQIQNNLNKKANSKRSLFLAKYLRAEQYGLGDKFLGLSVPDIRIISEQIGNLDFSILKSLIDSRIHEERFLAIINLVTQFEEFQKNQKLMQKKIIFEFYINEMLNGIDNWDLVDVSASKIIGAYLIDKPKLKDYYLHDILSISPNLWHRRIAMIATFRFIKNDNFNDTIKLAKLFLNDKEDLIHKSVGWMLREMGKRQEDLLINFLEENYQKMPRVMLRYSIERLNSELKIKYLNKNL
ncbi:MAG: hypothetical protein AM1032_000157 [Mycoplasmataceae bacterium]|nr:MAG: hypothetical protein AM1032_000157 [Mycoplasmataceae bacterium]